MLLLSRTIHFNAAHRLFNPQKSEEWNLATYGDASNPAGYGHNYTLDVSVAGVADAQSSMIVTSRTSIASSRRRSTGRATTAT